LIHERALLCPLVIKVILTYKMSMGHWWNNTERGKPKYSGKNLSQCHFVYHISHTDWSQIQRGTFGERLATNPKSHGMAFED
jgi:hypothetical protein